MRIRSLLAAGLALALALPAWAYSLKYSSGSAGLTVDATSDFTVFVDNADQDEDGDATETFPATTVVIHAKDDSGTDVCQYRLFEAGGTVIITTTSGTRIADDSIRTEVYKGTGSGWAGISYICASNASEFFVDAYR